MRPVLAKMCELRHLKDGTYSLMDVALMNDALDVQHENEQRTIEANKRG